MYSQTSMYADDTGLTFASADVKHQKRIASIMT